MAVKKLKIVKENLPDIQLIGIHTSLQDYRLAYFINKETQIKFERLDDLPVYDERAKVIREYSFFSFYDHDKRTAYYLFSNDHGTGKMIEQYSQANFFLMISENRNAEEIRNLLSKIRKISSVNFVFEAAVNKIKDMDGILQDLELHQINKSAINQS